MHGRPRRTGSSVAFSTCKRTWDPASRLKAWGRNRPSGPGEDVACTNDSNSPGISDAREISAGNQDQAHHGRMGHEGFEQRRPWPIFVATLGLVLFLVTIAEQRAAPGRTRIEQVLDSLERECAQHICCVTHGGCRTPGGRRLPEAADGLRGRLEEQAIEIFDTYPDRFTACEIIDSLGPRAPELEAICHPRSSADRLSREEVRAPFRERDDEISAILEGRRLP
jgi:hypothetical protein